MSRHEPRRAQNVANREHHADDLARERGRPAWAEHPSEDARFAREAGAPAGITPVEEPCVGSPGHSRQHPRSEEHTSELQSQSNLVCRLLLEKKKNTK